MFCEVKPKKKKKGSIQKVKKKKNRQQKRGIEALSIRGVGLVTSLLTFSSTATVL